MVEPWRPSLMVERKQVGDMYCLKLRVWQCDKSVGLNRIVTEPGYWKAFEEFIRREALNCNQV